MGEEKKKKDIIIQRDAVSEPMEIMEMQARSGRLDGADQGQLIGSGDDITWGRAERPGGNAHTGNRTPVTSMGGLYDTTTLCVRYRFI